MYNYITEGLEMFLDAKWNLGKNNYNSTTVNWHDLSDNENNGFVTAPTWDKKKLKFNGQDIESRYIHPNIGYEMIYKKNQGISITNNTEGDTKNYHFIIAFDVSGSMREQTVFSRKPSSI